MRVAGKEQAVLLVIGDISGYTRYMLDSQEARTHGYVIISELLQAILRELRSPLQVAKLEGDAVFLYAILPADHAADRELAQMLRGQIRGLFRAFETKLFELVQSNVCACGGCGNAHRLRLKMVLHRGHATFHRVGKYAELSGVDVILAHRLLKNSLHRDQYILLTDPARMWLWPEPDAALEAHEEEYDEIGRVATWVLAPEPETPEEAVLAHNYGSFVYRAKNILSRTFQARLLRLGLRRKLPLTHPDALIEPEKAGP